MKRLENWALVTTNSDPYKAPELCSYKLSGEVYGHPKFEDGTKVTTSIIIRTICNTEEQVVRTISGSIYELGDPDPEYEAMFPDAKARFFKANYL